MHPVLSPTSSLLLHLFSLCRLFCGFGASAETNCTITNYMLLMGRIKKKKKEGWSHVNACLHFFSPCTVQTSLTFPRMPSFLCFLHLLRKVCAQHALFPLHACAQLELSLTLSSTVTPLPPKMTHMKRRRRRRSVQNASNIRSRC